MAISAQISAVIVHPDTAGRNKFETICAEREIRVAGRCGDGKTAIGMAARLRPSVVLLAVTVGNPPLPETISGIRAAAPGCRIMLLCRSQAEAAAYRTAGLPVDVCMPTDGFVHDMAGIIEAVVRGERRAVSNREDNHRSAADVHPFGDGRMFGRWRIVKRLGSGGMGVVYLALDTGLNRQVAIKFLPDQLRLDPARIHQAREEALSVASLQHPNIVVLHDIVTEEQREFLVFEYVSGETLREHISPPGMLIAHALEYMAQTASGLAAAHAQGIIHRDIKPENLMLTAGNRIKILDFGIAQLKTAPAWDQQGPEPAAPAAKVMGTIDYMSPEQATGPDLDFATDVFSLGVVLHELLSGVHPFRGRSAFETLQAIMKKEAPPLADVSSDIQDIVNQALRKDPRDRFRSMRDLESALRGVVQSSASTTG